MSGYTAWCTYNLALLILIGLAIYWTGSLWAFVGLFGLSSYSPEDTEGSD